jgi:hypothetical protein
MFKLQSLVLGFIAATLCSSQAQATDFPDRFSFREATPTTHNSFDRQLRAQVVKPTKRSTNLKQPKLEKVPLKTLKYPEVRMQPSSDFDRLECERLHRLSQSGSLPPNMTVKTSITLGQPINPTCSTDVKVSDPQPFDKK